MTFLSLQWLIWIWITVSVYWMAPRSWRALVLFLISLVFLASHSPTSALLLIAFCGLSHVAGNLMRPTVASLSASIAAMVGVLIYFKLNQRVDLNGLVDTLVIPLGLSYYTFRCIHFLLERYKDKIDKTTLDDLVGYLFFIPTLYIGPIHRYDDYRRDRLRQRFDPAMLSEGAERIVYGYAKVIILGNYLTGAVLGSYIDGLEDPTSPFALYLTVVQNGLNLYFQFAGYSDIAIGFAMLLGYRVIENFDSPYFKPNISAFWRSWHISLSRWCRNYIYGPVVARTRSPALGALATMITIGLWHEISLRFLLWGTYHGFGIIVWQLARPYSERLVETVPVSVRWPLHIASVLVTVNFVWFGFVILTAGNISDALATYRSIIFPWLE